MIKVMISSLLLLFMIGCDSDKTENSQDVRVQRPLIFQLSPALSSYGYIPVNSRLVVTSSEALDPLTVNPNTVLLFKDKEPVKINVTLVGKEIVITPLVYLEERSDYNLQITTDVATSTGKSLSRSKYLYFTSGDQFDFDAPTLIKTLPVDDIYNQIDSYTHIYFKFNEPISPFLSPESYKIMVSCSHDINYTNSQFKISGDTLSIIPDEVFPYESSITIELNTSTLTDLAGNHFNGPSLITVNSSTVPIGNDTPKTLFEERDEPANPNEAFLSTLTFNTQRHINNLIVHENTIYIAAQEGLLLLDLNASTGEFTPQGSLDYDKVGYVYDVAFYPGDILFLASSKGVITLNISNKKSPKVLSFYESTSPVYALTMSELIFPTQLLPAPKRVGNSLSDNVLYAAGTLNGLLIFDIDTEGIPHFRNAIDLNSSLMDVARNKDKNIILTLYDIGAKLYDTNNADVIPMFGIQADDIFRQVTDTPIQSRNYFAAGVGGVVTIDPTSVYFPPRTDLPAASCVTKIEDYHANVKDIGLAKVYYNALGPYFTFNFNVKTFTIGHDFSLNYDFTFLADDEGIIHLFLEPVQ